jgi:hypothetical protein
LLRPDDVFPKTGQDLPRHALSVDRLGQLRSNLARHAARHALEVNVIAVGHVGHCGGGVDVCAVGGYGMDGRYHNLEAMLEHATFHGLVTRSLPVLPPPWPLPLWPHLPA